VVSMKVREEVNGKGSKW